MYKESNGRTIAKTVSWRLIATITTALLVYIFTGNFYWALSIGAIEIIAKMIMYYLHERAWNRVQIGKKEARPYVIWLTGLSGSGKSTIGTQLVDSLRIKGYKVEHLDGDIVRKIFPRTGFSKEERDRHIRRVGFLSSMLEKNGIIVVASFIAPYLETRSFVRNLCNNFIEVHVSTPLEICEKRDPKGLYKKVRNGEIQNFTGIDDPYEVPDNPEIRIDTTNQSVTESVNQILNMVI